MLWDVFSTVQDFMHFFLYLDADRILHYFWMFLIFDLPRYVLLDLLVIFIYLPLKYIHRHRDHRARQQLFKERPLVSIIVPGKNEGKHLTKLAMSLRQQTYSKLEIIIVDDGSDDDTPVVGRRLKQQGLIDYFIRNEERGGKASAANTGLIYAKGRFIVHLDADLHLNNNAIERVILPFMIDERIGMVGGDVRVRNADDSLTARVQAIEYMKGISVGRSVASMVGMLRIVSGAFGAFRADVLRDELKGWDVGPGLDGDITLKFRNLGWKIFHEPRAVCYTHVPNTLPKLARQRLRWDRSIVRFRVRKHVHILKVSKNFRMLDFLTVFENLFSNIFLNILWWMYLFQIVFFDSEFLLRIFVINYFLYLASNIIAYIIALCLQGDTLRLKDYALVFFLPLMPFYIGFYLRVVRTYAYMSEFICKSSYNDTWNPWKVSSIAKKEGL